MGNVVAILGRPNVGKSTLFNRLVGERKAIVDDISGVTRDRIYGVGEWLDKEFSVIDTGGFVEGSTDIFESAIRDQVKIAIQEANVLLFVVDAHEGINPMDEEVARLLFRTPKPVLLVVNKVDNHEQLLSTSEFYALGFEKIFPVAAASGSGTGELLEELIKHLSFPETDTEKQQDERPRIAVVGRPNVGKSSLINALMGEERNIVTDIAGTTRDAINSEYKYFGKDLILVDTAGIRRKSRVKEDLEFYSVMRSIKAIEEADVIMLVLDAQLGIEGQDLSLFQLAKERQKGVVIIVNKWDLIEKDTKTTMVFEKQIHEKIAPFVDVPIIFISAVTKQRIFKALETALEVAENRRRKIPTHQLNEYLHEVIAAYPPPSIKGKFVKIKYVTQLPTHAPAFALFCNLPQYVRESYSRYLENKMREHFNFSGVPLRLFFRKK